MGLHLLRGGQLSFEECASLHCMAWDAVCRRWAGSGGSGELGEHILIEIQVCSQSIHVDRI